MTVQELIDELESLPEAYKEYDVQVVRDYGGSEEREVKHITKHEDSGTVTIVTN